MIYEEDRMDYETKEYYNIAGWQKKNLKEHMDYKCWKSS